MANEQEESEAAPGASTSRSAVVPRQELPSSNEKQEDARISCEQSQRATSSIAPEPAPAPAQAPGTPPRAAPRTAATVSGTMQNPKTTIQMELVEAVRLREWKDVSASLTVNSLFLFPKERWPRKPLILLVTWSVFEQLMLGIILANCVVLALDSNAPGFSSTSMAHSLQTANLVFLIVFTVEATFKIIAFGFILGDQTYLKDGWNVLDLLIVSAGWLEVLNFGNYTALRCIRVLRSLRAVSKIPKLRALVMTVILSLPMLMEVMILAAFFYAVFGALTLEVFGQGALKGRCSSPDFTNSTTVLHTDGRTVVQGVNYIVPSSEWDSVCQGPATSKLVWYNDSGVLVPEGVVTGTGRTCAWEAGTDPLQPYGMFCTPFRNPGEPGGYRHFDDVTHAFLALFLFISTQDWSQVMYDTQDGVSVYVWPLSALILVIGGVVIVNLFLAVLYIQFTKHGASFLEKTTQARRSFSNTLQPTVASRESSLSGVTWSGRGNRVAPLGPGGTEGSMHLLTISSSLQPPAESSSGKLLRSWFQKLQQVCLRLQLSPAFERAILTIIIVNALLMVLEWYEMPSEVAFGTQVAYYTCTMLFAVEMTIKLLGVGVVGYFQSWINCFDCVVTLAGIAEMAVDLANITSASQALSAARAMRLLRLFHLASSWAQLHRVMMAFRNSASSIGWLTLLLVFFLFLGSLLGMELFGYKVAFCDSVPGSSQHCFSSVVQDCPPHWDCYVPCSNTSAGQWVNASGSPYGDMAYCETVHPAGDASTPAEYWAQVGKVTVPPQNFDTFWHGQIVLTLLPLHGDLAQGFLTLFQILTMDNWDTAMYNFMSSTNTYACLYFVISMIIGRFVVLNLFLAILLHGFVGLEDDLPSEPSSQSEEGEGAPVQSQVVPMVPRAPFVERGKRKHLSSRLQSSELMGSRTRSDKVIDSCGPRTASVSFAPAIKREGSEGSDAGSNETGSPTDGLDPECDDAATPPVPQRLVSGACDTEPHSRSSFPAATPTPSSLFAPSASLLSPQLAPPASEPASGNWTEVTACQADDVRQSPARAGAAAGPNLSGDGSPDPLNPWQPAGPVAEADEGAGLADGGTTHTGVEAAGLIDDAAPEAVPECWQPPASESATPAVEPRPASSKHEDPGSSVTVSPRDELLAGPSTPSFLVNPSRCLLDGSRSNSSSSSSSSSGGGGGEAGPAVDQAPASPPSGRSSSHDSAGAVARVQSATKLLMQPGIFSSDECHSGDALPSDCLAPADLKHAPEGLGSRPSTARHKDEGTAMSLTQLLSLYQAAAGEMEKPPPPPPPMLAKGQGAAPPRGQAGGPAPQAPEEQEARSVKRRSVGFNGGHGAAETDGTLEVSRRPRSVAGSDVSATSTRKYSTITDSVAAMKLRQELAKQQPGISLRGSSLFIFGPDNPARVVFKKIVDSQSFEFFTLMAILGSCITLSLETPSLDNGSALGRATYFLDIIFTAFFTVEAVMKIVVLGFLFNGRQSYLRLGWNILDFFVLLISITVLVLEVLGISQNILWLRALRAIRVLRVLRAASRFTGIQVVVEALFRAMPAMLDVALVALLFFYIFAVLAVHLLSGQMSYCVDSDGNLLDPNYFLADGENINKTWCQHYQQNQYVVVNSSYHDLMGITVQPFNMTALSWTTPLRNFNNFGAAIWVLFVMSLQENWSEVMFLSGNVNGIDQQPSNGAWLYGCLFFIMFMVVCSFFVLNLVISVAIDKFNVIKKQKMGVGFLLSEEQREWLTIQRLMATVAIHRTMAPPSAPFRRFMFRVSTSPHFDTFIITVISLNVLMLLTVYDGMSPAWLQVLYATNAAFTGIYLLEVFVKLTGLGVHAYFQCAWNTFDVVVVLAGIVTIVIDYTVDDAPLLMMLVRLLRVVRIAKLIPKIKSFRLMFMTFYWSLPALFNVATVTMLLMFIYAVIGMNLFGNMMYGAQLNRHANFENLPHALQTLFRMLTGENWDYIMRDCMQRENCIRVTEDWTNGTDVPLVYAGTFLDPRDPLLDELPSSLQSNQCTPAPILSILYFCSYMVLICLVMLQLIIAVILDNIQSTSYTEHLSVKQQHLTQFVETWEQLDLRGSSFIHCIKLTALLCGVDPPFGVRKLPSPALNVQAMVFSCRIPIRNNCVHFMETLHALAGRVAGVPLPAEEEFEIHSHLIAKLPKDEKPPKYTAAHYYGAVAVQTAIRGYMLRHEITPMVRAMNAELRAANASMKLAAGASAPEAGVKSKGLWATMRTHMTVRSTVTAWTSGVVSSQKLVAMRAAFRKRVSEVMVQQKLLGSCVDVRAEQMMKARATRELELEQLEVQARQQQEQLQAAGAAGAVELAPPVVGTDLKARPGAPRLEVQKDEGAALLPPAAEPSGPDPKIRQLASQLFVKKPKLSSMFDLQSLSKIKAKAELEAQVGEAPAPATQDTAPRPASGGSSAAQLVSTPGCVPENRDAI